VTSDRRGEEQAGIRHLTPALSPFEAERENRRQSVGVFNGSFRFLRKSVCIRVHPRLNSLRLGVFVIQSPRSQERYERAAKLFKEHAAPRIIVSGYGDCEINRYLLITAGVPANAIELENKSRTTRENAQFTIKLLRERKLKRVIIVTSWYHSRRARACFRHYAPELKVYSRPSYFAATRTDWSHNRIGSRVRLEYVKLLGYWVRYGVCPF
jgi:hypothetical protein